MQSDLALIIQPISYYEDFPFKVIVTNQNQQQVKGSAMMQMTEEATYFDYELKIHPDWDDLYIGLDYPTHWRKVDLTKHEFDDGLYITSTNVGKIYLGSVNMFRLTPTPKGLNLLMPYKGNRDTINFIRLGHKQKYLEVKYDW